MRYLKTGIIALLFALTQSALAETAPYTAVTDTTVKGRIISLDRDKGAGILRQDQTNKLVHFRFASKIKDKNVDSLKVGHVVEFTLGSEEKSVAALD